MLLDDSLRDTLAAAIRAYDFPCGTYDFAAEREVVHPSMRGVEQAIRSGLTADDMEAVRDGLSNVLYWGYARIDYGDRRVRRFREGVTEGQLHDARSLFRTLRGPGLRQIKRLGLPELSGMSFVSKVRMFLDPSNYVTLDMKLAKNLSGGVSPGLFDDLSFRPGKDTTIRITAHNEAVYERWCRLCRHLAATCFPGAGVRAADIERGIFHLVSTNACLVADILATA